MTLAGFAFTAAELRQRAAARLLGEIPALEASARWSRSDWDLSPDLAVDAALEVKRAAVLVAILDRGDGAQVILTERTHTMPTHAGQIAFPGGRIGPDDGSPLETALREAEEEIGLSPAQVSVIGYLDAYRTGTGYLIAPVVGVVRPAFTPTPQEREVASVFEVPLAFLMDPANHHVHERDWRGQRRRYHAMPFNRHYIWGATAGMLKNLYERVYAR